MGTAGDDVLVGTPGDDVICGLRGDDRLVGRGGDDSLFGDGGNDVVVGGPGDDLVRGGVGDDVVSGGNGDDRLRGKSGDDELRGGRGNDNLHGGEGSDVVQGGPGRDVASYTGQSTGVRASIGDGANDGGRGEGDDIGSGVEDLRGGRGGDVLVGSAGANRLFGSRGGDRLVGLGGDDRLIGGAGSDRLDGRDSAGFVDVLRCGPGGGDRVLADMGDRVRGGCESVVQNDPPTNITLVPASVAENRPPGTTVGTLTTTDPDAGDNHTYTLVAGAGSADNGSFTIAGAQLRTRASFDFETKASYSIRVRSSDGLGGTFTRALTVSVTDVVENNPPTGIALDNTTVAENQPAATPVGTLSTTDPDAGDGHSYTLVTASGCAGGDNGSFTITDDLLQTAAGLDFEDDADLDVCVRSSDGRGGMLAVPFTITVTDVNDAPTAITLDNTTVAENEPAGTTVGVLSAADQDDGDSHTFTLVAGAGDTDNSSFAIAGDELVTTAVFDFEIEDSLSVRVEATDAAGASVEQPVTITVTNVNEAPTAIALDNTLVAENVPAGATVGTFTTTDPDTDTHTYSLVAGAGDTDNSSFAIDGDELVTAAVFDFEIDDTFSVRVRSTDSGGESVEAQFTITVTDVNDAPTAIVLDNTTVAENEPVGTTVGVLSATDQDTDTHTFTLVAGAGDTDNASFAINGDELVTDDVFDFETDNSFSVRVRATDSGGASFDQQFTITVTDVNDAPTAITLDDTTVAENEPVGTTVGTLSATDQDIETHTFTLVAGAGDTDNASFAISGDELVTAASFDADTDDSLTIRVRATDSGGASFEQQFTITVTNLNEAPSIVAPATISAERDTPTPVTGISVADPDTGDIELTLTAGNGTIDVDETASSAVVSGDGTATVVITGTVTEINTILTAGVTYLNDAGFAGPSDSVQLDVDDLGAPALTASATITIQFNQPPVADDQSVDTAEDTAATITLSASDADGDTVTFAIVTAPTNGALGAIGPVTCNPATNTCTADVVYTPTDDFNGSDSFTFTAADAVATSDPATVSITVTPVNDNPTANDDTFTTIEDTALVLPATGPDSPAGNDTDVDADTLTVTDVSAPVGGNVTLVGGTITFTPVDDLCGTAAGGFTYTVGDGNGGSDTGQVTVDITCVDDPPDAVDDFATVLEDAAATAVDVLANDTDVDAGPKVITGITQPGNGTVVITGGGTGLTYQPTANYCNTQAGGTPDTFTYTITGDDEATVAMTVTCVDDPPDAVNDIATVLEDAAASAVDALANDTDIDAGPKTINAVTQPGSGTVVITGGGTGLTYQPTANYCNSQAGGTPDTFTYTLNGGSQATVSVTVTCVNDNPVADDETFNGANGAIGNTALVVNAPPDGAPTVTGPNKAISGDILAGDTDIDGPGPLVVQAGTFTSNDGGSVTIQADGDFVFTPAAGTSCTDTSDFFDYTLSDQNTPTAGTDTGRVTISIADCVWYVSNNAAGNSGTSTAPFDTLAQAETASAAGHTIFVFDGDNTTTGYTAGITLKANQRLIGEAANLVVGTVTLHTGVPANRPTVTDNNADVVELAAANTVTGVAIDPQGAGGGIAGGSGDNSGTITDVNIADTAPFGTQPGLELDATSGTFGISNLTVNTNGAIGVRLNNAGTVNFASAGTVTITTSGARALDAAGATTSFGASSVIDDVTVTGSGTGGINLTATTGALTLGDGTGTDLSLTTTSGPAAAFFSTHTGTLTVNPFGTDNVSATGGPALDITGAGTFDFDDVDSTNSTTDGINLDNFATGTFTAASGDIAGAAGIVFDLNGGSGAVTYPGTIGNGPGNSTEITGRTGGTVTLSGTINDTNDAGGGITLTGNTGGTTNISGTTKTLNTTNTTAVTFTGSNGHTFNLTGGNLDIDTTSGQGINADDAGTITITGTNNTISTTTGTALTISTTDIGAADVTLLNVSANSAPNGIVLNATGAVGNLVVTGDGDGNPDGGGGTIQNTSGHGISLTGTQSPSLTDVSVANAGNADNEYGLFLTNVGGTTTLDDMSFNNAGDNLVYLTSTTSSTFNVTGSTFTYPTVIGPTANSAILLEPGGAANLTASVTGTTFTNIVSASTQIGANTAGASGTLSLTFSNNTINSATGRAGGVAVSGQEQTTTNLTINGNQFTGAGGNGVISVDTNDASTVTGTISNNTITNPPGIGIFSAVDEDATSTLTFNGNTVTNAGGDGIQLANFGSPMQPALTSEMNATVTNNTVNGHSLNTAVSFVGGISVSSFEEVMDLQLTGNTVTGTPTAPTQCGGAPCVDYYLEEVGGTFRLEEIPDTAATTATAAYVNSTNDAGPVTIFGVIDLSNGVEISSS